MSPKLSSRAAAGVTGTVGAPFVGRALSTPRSARSPSVSLRPGSADAAAGLRPSPELAA